MLNGDNNENGIKKSKGSNQQKKNNFACVAHFFIPLPLFCTTTTSNFQKLPSLYTFYRGNVVCIPIRFFSLPLILTFVAASTCHFLTASKNCLCFPSGEIRHVCFFCLLLFLC